MTSMTIRRGGRRVCPIGHEGDSVTWTDYRVEEWAGCEILDSYRVTLRDAGGSGRSLERDGRLYLPGAGAGSYLIRALRIESGYPGHEVTVTDEHAACSYGEPVVLVAGELL